MNIGQRIREKRKDLGLTQAQLAEYFRISSVSVSEWERGQSKPDQDKLVPLARLLKTSVSYLLTGKESNEAVSTNYDSLLDEMLVIQKHERRKYPLPLISWVQAGNWGDSVGEFRKEDAEDWIPCPFNHGPNAFILRVVGLSMYNPGGDKSYAPGDFIAVDPEGEIQNKKMVVVRVDHEEKATFKQLLIDSEGTMMLQALNPAHIPRTMSIPEGSRIVGTVIGKWVPE